MKSVVKHPEAEREITEAAEYYERSAPGLGGAFLVEAQACTTAIELHPQTGFPHDRGTRMRLLHRFPYGMISRNERTTFLCWR